MSAEKYTLVKDGLLIDTRLSATDDGRYPLFIDATAVGRLPEKHERELASRQILKLLIESGIGYHATTDEAESSDLLIQIGLTRHGYGVFGMDAMFSWPDLPDGEASMIATRAMRQMARNLGLYPEASNKELAGMVYAHLDRRSGITLETNPAGSSSMDTNGSRYRPGAERVKLESHNLYTHEMQLVCIAGIIALAKARR